MNDGAVDSTKDDDRKESVIFIGYGLKSSEYIMTSNGRAVTAQTVQTRGETERWPWDRAGRRRTQLFDRMGVRRGHDRERDKEVLPRSPAEAGFAKSAFDVHGLTEACLGCRAMRWRIRAPYTAVL